MRRAKQMKPICSVGVELEVRAYDRAGNLIATRTEQADLVVKNLRRLISYLLQRDVINHTATDIGGANRTISIWRTASSKTYYPFCFVSTVSLDQIRMAVGTGTISPSVDDYALGSEVAAGTSPTKTFIEAADYSATLYYAMSFTLASAADITEAGIWFAYATADGEKWHMFARDTFAAVSVPAGGTISVTYKFTTSF